jgi:hypothetical protein
VKPDNIVAPGCNIIIEIYVSRKIHFMIKIFFTLSMVLIFTALSGQKTEYRLGFSSGLFSFSGKSAQTTSFINYSEPSNTGYTNNPYGSQQGLCYGLLANMKRVSKKKFVFGIEAGFERVKSVINITLVNNYDGMSATQFPVEGKTYLAFNFINFQPFAGYRFVSKRLAFDLTAGVDLAYCLQAKENGNATAENGTTYNTSLDRKTITTDIRPRLQISTGYKNFGVYLGYAFGQTNYKSGHIGGTNEAYAEFLRFGLTYLLK